MLRVPMALTSSSEPGLMCGSRFSPGDGSASVLVFAESVASLLSAGVGWWSVPGSLGRGPGVGVWGVVWGVVVGTGAVWTGPVWVGSVGTGAGNGRDLGDEGRGGDESCGEGKGREQTHGRDSSPGGGRAGAALRECRLVTWTLVCAFWIRRARVEFDGVVGGQGSGFVEVEVRSLRWGSAWRSLGSR